MGDRGVVAKPVNSGPPDTVETPGRLVVVLGAPPNPDGSPSAALRALRYGSRVSDANPTEGR
jgi:hypothetical protein